MLIQGILERTETKPNKFSMGQRVNSHSYFFFPASILGPLKSRLVYASTKPLYLSYIYISLHAYLVE